MKLLFNILSALIIFLSALNAQENNPVGYPPNYNSVIPSLNFKDTDIRDILRAMAIEYKTNIVVDNKISQKISTALFDISLFDAVKIISSDNGLLFAYDSLRFYVKTVPETAPPPEKEPEPYVSFDKGNNHIDIRLKNVSVNRFVQELREKTGRNFLLSSGTSGKISGELRDINYVTGIQNILRNSGFYLTEKDSIYYISRSSYFSATESVRKDNRVYWVSANGKSVTIDVKEASLNKIMDDITGQLDLQIIKLASPNATITVKCNNVDLDRALYYMFKGTEFSFKKEEETYIIGKKSEITLSNIRLVRLKHLRADKLKEKLPGQLFPGASASVDIEHNALVLTGPNEPVSQMADYIDAIDQPVPQVMIEALVVDYNLDKLFEMGISAGSGDSATAARSDQWFPGLDVTASGNKINQIFKDIGNINLFGKDINVGNLGKLPEDFFINIRMLEQDGVANVRSRPVLSALNGHKASLKVGQIQNYVFKEIMPLTSQVNTNFIEREQIEKIEAFISFEITPWVGPDNQLTLELKPDFQTPIGNFSPDKNEIPAINTRTLESTVRLKHGETIVLGGLIQDKESTTIRKFPILGDIPFLKEIFSSKSRQRSKAELIIYLTPKIFYEDYSDFSYYEYAK